MLSLRKCAMDLGPIASTSPAIKIHLATVLPAYAIGTWLLFFSAKGWVTAG
jgi:hypothetical protein